MRSPRRWICLCLALLGVNLAWADDEACPSRYIVANGVWYAKCIPSDAPTIADRISPEDRQWKGKTFVYWMGKDGDKLEYTFDWYSPHTYISGYGGGVTLVRQGRWPGGHKASPKDLALSFYRNDQLVATYSTLDLAESERNVSYSVSHYMVIKEVVGFVDIFKKVGEDTLFNQPAHGFEVILHDGRHLLFDPQTGQRIPMVEGISTRRIP